MNFNVANLPAVRAQLERDAVEVQAEAERDAAPVPTYARAPVASGPQQTGARPAAIQKGAR